jgi:hypothetical protein
MTADWNGYRQQLVETIVKSAQLSSDTRLFSRPFLINALAQRLFNRPTMCPAWRVRSNGGPGLESKGSPASQFPRPLLFYGNSSCVEPRFPTG